MGKALNPGHVTEHVSMKERGLEQSLRGGWAEPYGRLPREDRPVQLPRPCE